VKAVASEICVCRVEVANDIFRNLKDIPNVKKFSCAGPG
jgi:hypothetical protein